MVQLFDLLIQIVVEVILHWREKENWSNNEELDCRKLFAYKFFLGPSTEPGEPNYKKW